jgi:hypothetical protein
MKKKKVIPTHESSVRRVVSDAHNLPYYPLKDIQEARKYEDAIMVFEGDTGGQIYLVCPVQMVNCSSETLRKLLLYLDEIAWPNSDDSERGIFFERKKVGEIIIGGMGGGRVEQDLWVHDEFKHMKGKIKNVITGKVDDIT